MVGSLCKHSADFITSHARQFSTLVLCSLGEKDPGVVGPLWEAALLVINLIQVRGSATVECISEVCVRVLARIVMLSILYVLHVYSRAYIVLFSSGLE